MSGELKSFFSQQKIKDLFSWVLWVIFEQDTPSSDSFTWEAFKFICLEFLYAHS